MKRIYKLTSFLLCLTLVFSLFSVNLSTLTASAANRDTATGQWTYSKIERGTVYSMYGSTYTSCYYKINGKNAICMQPEKNGPLYGSGGDSADSKNVWTRYVAVSNTSHNGHYKNIRKLMYNFQNKATSFNSTLNKALTDAGFSDSVCNNTNRYQLVHMTLAYFYYDGFGYWSSCQRVALSSSWQQAVKNLAKTVSGMSAAPEDYPLPAKRL